MTIAHRVYQIISEVVLSEEAAIYQAVEKKPPKGHLECLDEEWLSDLAMQHEMSAYQLAGFRACEPHLDLLSIAVDGSRVCCKKRLFGCALLPTGECVWWPPQAAWNVLPITLPSTLSLSPQRVDLGPNLVRFLVRFRCFWAPMCGAKRGYIL